MSTTSSVKQ